jgi:transposase
MIVIGVDVHKHSLTAAAVDENGRLLAERMLVWGEEGLLVWAAALDGERLWAVEDCRHVSGALERQLVAAGERLVRVPPRLTAPERRAGRRRGKSDAIDALATARAALREPELDRPRPGEERLRELKLLVVHRDDLVDERRRCQQRLRWHQLDPAFAVAPGALDRAVQLERASRRLLPSLWVGRFLARREQTVQVRIARELVARCRSLTRSIRELEQELGLLTARTAPSLLELPGCGVLSAAKLLSEIGPIERFRTDAQLARHGGVAPLEASSGRSQRHRLDRGGNRQLNCALHRIAVTQARMHPPARAYLERKFVAADCPLRAATSTLDSASTPSRPMRSPSARSSAKRSSPSASMSAGPNRDSIIGSAYSRGLSPRRRSAAPQRRAACSG